MYKKLIMVCMAVAAFAAFVMPAVASASPELTHPTGTTYCPKDEAGKECLVTGTNVGNWVLKSSLGNIECNSVVLTGTLTENSGTSIKGDINSATFGNTGTGGDCTGPLGTSIAVTTNVGNGVPWCLSANNTMAADEFQVRGGACTAESRSITFVLHITGGRTCYYNRTAVVKGTFTTDTTGDAILSFSEQEWTLEKEEGSGLIPCPSSGKLNGAATLETDTKASADPMFIS
jgi:hypothetical protein